MREEESVAAEQRGDVFVISDLETLKVVADPLRLEILERLRETPKTVKQVAAELGANPTRLYYHFRTLEEHDLILVRGTRVVSGIIEKQYQTTAYRLTVERALLGPSDESERALDVLLAVILDEAAAEIRKGVRAGTIDPTRTEDLDGGMVLGRKWVRLTPAQARRFAERLLSVYDEVLAWDDPAGASDARTYETLIGIYPTDAWPKDGRYVAARAPRPGEDDA